jgi:hypothetical protein
MKAARSPIKGMEVRELEDREAFESLVTDFGQLDAPTEPAPLLELVPIEADEEREKLVRAGFIESAASERSTLRAELQP